MTSLTVLCTDGSELATAALAAGLRVLAPAERTIVVTVVEPVDASLLLGASGFAGGVMDEQQYAETVEAHRDAAEEILGAAVSALGLDGNASVETVAIEGDPGRALCDLAAERGATVLVAGSRGRGGLNAPCSDRCPITWCAMRRAPSSSPARRRTEEVGKSSGDFEQPAVDRRRRRVEAHETNPFDRRRGRADGVHGDLRRRRRRVAVDTGGDRREGDRAGADPVRLLERRAGSTKPARRPRRRRHRARLGRRCGSPSGRGVGSQELSWRRRWRSLRDRGKRQATPGQRHGGSPRRHHRRRAATRSPR